jgi:hypothetical protein
MFTSTNLRQQHFNKKLSNYYLESFKIIRVIKRQIYELKLLKKWMIYSVFHVSLLKSYKNKLSENSAFYSETAFLNKNEE